MLTVYIYICLCVSSVPVAGAFSQHQRKRNIYIYVYKKSFWAQNFVINSFYEYEFEVSVLYVCTRNVRMCVCKLSWAITIILGFLPHSQIHVHCCFLYKIIRSSVSGLPLFTLPVEIIMIMLLNVLTLFFFLLSSSTLLLSKSRFLCVLARAK